jgi:NAD+ diphosphatase
MNHLNRSANNCFVSEPLERLTDKRSDSGWLKHQLKKDDTRLLLLWRGKNLLQATNPPKPALLTLSDIDATKVNSDRFLLLGTQNGIVHYALDLPAENDQIPEKFSSHGVFKDLRMVGALLDAGVGAILAYARGLTYWHRHHRFCGLCGRPTKIAEAGHLMTCSDPDCGHKQFPRTDPAIITIIHDQKHCLLGRQAGWPKGIYATIAGFVEPGESLEAAVAREVKEETGVEVESVTYHSSQPWPFPCSIMLGFSAKARTTAICSGDNELEDARWFSRPEIINGLEKGTLKLPSMISISYRLIEHWFDQGTHGHLAEHIAG